MARTARGSPGCGVHAPRTFSPKCRALPLRRLPPSRLSRKKAQAKRALTSNEQQQVETKIVETRTDVGGWRSSTGADLQRRQGTEDSQRFDSAAGDRRRSAPLAVSSSHVARVQTS